MYLCFEFHLAIRVNDLRLLDKDLTQWFCVEFVWLSYPSTSDFRDTLPLITLVKDSHRNIPSSELEPKSCTCTQQTLNSKVPLPSPWHLPTGLLFLGNVVQSYGATSAPADCCHSTEYHRGSHKQHAERDVDPASGVCHPTDPPWGSEDPPWIGTVSHRVLLSRLKWKILI